jgi:MerR family transcriptional regulator, light-induced transcriptional regulator
MRIRGAFEQTHAVVDSTRPDAPGSKDAALSQHNAANGRVRRASFVPHFTPDRAQGIGMSPPSRRTSLESGGKLSIGALSRATRIPVETLRTWEARYGFPVPERKPSGHRVYSLASIPRLRRIAEALARGHRAGDVVGAPDEALADLLTATALPAPSGRSATAVPEGSQADLLRAVETFDAGGLTHILLRDWARLGPLDFLQARIAPAIRDVGDAWENGRLEIRHEHFFSERVGDLLRSLRLPFEERAAGPLVVCSSLPGETHSLGLQMAALVLAVSGCRILFVGTEVPASQVASLAKDLNARAVAISVSRAARGAAMATQIANLRRLLPRRIGIVVGGDGAPRSRPGVEVIQNLATLDGWGRRLATTA